MLVRFETRSLKFPAMMWFKENAGRRSLFGHCRNYSVGQFETFWDRRWV